MWIVRENTVIENNKKNRVERRKHILNFPNEKHKIHKRTKIHKQRTDNEKLIVESFAEMQNKRGKFAIQRKG